MGTRLNRLAEAVLTSTHNLCFEQKYENIRVFFLSKHFNFLVVKFSVYLNRRVFVMLLYCVSQRYMMQLLMASDICVH